MPHFMIVLIPNINSLNLSLIQFEEYGAVKRTGNNSLQGKHLPTKGAREAKYR